MYGEDIYKITFQTHSELYEWVILLLVLVMLLQHFKIL